MMHNQPASAEPIAPEPIDRASLAVWLAAADDVAGTALLAPAAGDLRGRVRLSAGNRRHEADQQRECASFHASCP